MCMSLTSEHQNTWGKNGENFIKRNKFAIIVKDFSTLLSVIERYSRQKISIKIVELNRTINQLDLTDIYGILCPTTTEYTVVSYSHRTFSKICSVL
jgi:hypothetical protein